MINMKQLLREAMDISIDKQKSMLERLEQKIVKLYPNVQTSIVDNADRTQAMLDVNTGETEFLILCRPGSKGTMFYVDGRWPQDEKGRRNLDGNSMVKSIGSIPGVA
jgi:hypothetical protein